MKKILAFILAFCMLGVMLAACSEDGDVSDVSADISAGGESVSYDETFDVTSDDASNAVSDESAEIDVSDNSQEESVPNEPLETSSSDDPSAVFTILPDLNAATIYYCSENSIVFKSNDGKCYLANRAGKVLTQGYDSALCSNPDGYFVAYNGTSKLVGTTEDPDYGTLNTTQYDTDSYVIDSNGKIVFSKHVTYIAADMSSTTYEGEYIVSCNDDRIVTVTSNTYHFGMAFSTKTVYVYDMQGKRIASFEEIKDVGTYIDGKLILINSSNEISVVDKSGNVLHACNIGDSALDAFTVFFPNNAWTTNGFINGYAILGNKDWGTDTLLISENLQTKYYINGNLLYDTVCYGTLIATKIITDGQESDDYYIVDVSKCKTDTEGFVVPTIDAAILKHGYSDIIFSTLFNNSEKYILVSKDDKWGFVSVDGGTEKLYDDAGSFYNGVAIVKEGDNVYLIDESFNRISDVLTGYQSVSTLMGDNFCVKKGGKLFVVIYN